MRALLIDELNKRDVGLVRTFLKDNAIVSEVEDLFWIELNKDLLDAEQYLAEADQPFCFAVEVGDSWVKCEFLVRSRYNFRSERTKYASRLQREFIIAFANGMIEELDLKT